MKVRRFPKSTSATLASGVETSSDGLRSWGLDLSGTEQGAGGVGGLLYSTQLSTNNPQQSFFCYDGNGNVAALLDASGSTMSARYEYGPFGERIRASGLLAKTNPFRFSTKYQDEETRLSEWLSPIMSA
jgi:hypothetical protein